MNSSIIHDNICSLIHKICHLQSYPSDIKQHMALHTVFIGGRRRLVTSKVLANQLNFSMQLDVFLHSEYGQTSFAICDHFFTLTILASKAILFK